MTVATATTSDSLVVPQLALDDIVKAQVRDSLQPYLFEPTNNHTLTSALTAANDTINNYYTGTGTAIGSTITSTDGLYDNSTTTAVTQTPLRFARVNESSNEVIFSTDIGYTTGTATDTITWTNDGSVNLYDYVKFDQWGIHVKDKKTSLREKFKSNLIIRTKSRVDIPDDITDNERIAMETLREMISEADYRKYIKDGFILVKAASGKVYQIFRTKWHTRVWRGGKVIEEICVRIKGDKIPPTDNVIAFKTMLEVSEDEFRKTGNVYNFEKVA